MKLCLKYIEIKFLLFLHFEYNKIRRLKNRLPGILSVGHPNISVVSGILSVRHPSFLVVSGILSVGHPIFSVVSGILSVVGIPPVPVPIPEEIQLLMYAHYIHGDL